MIEIRRKYRITVDVDGHTFEDALRELLSMADHVAEHGETCSSLGGGGSAGHIVSIDVHPTMTPEQHELDLTRWKEAHDRGEVYPIATDRADLIEVAFAQNFALKELLGLLRSGEIVESKDKPLPEGLIRLFTSALEKAERAGVR